MDARNWLVFVAVLLATAPLAQGLFEDQVGMWDWHQQFVGRVKSAVFSSGTQKKRVYVATEQNALAALNLRTGQLVWRHVFGDGDAIQRLESAGRTLVTISGDGKFVRSWNPNDGVLLWETTTYSSAEGRASAPVDFALLSFDWDGDGAHDFAVLAGNDVFIFSTLSGELLWRTRVLTDITLQKLHAYPDSKRLAAGGFVGVEGPAASKLAVLNFDLPASKKEEPVHKAHMSFEPLQPLSTATLLFSNGYLVALSSDGSTLVTHSLTSSAGFEASVADLIPSKGGAQLLPGVSRNAVALSSGGGVVLLRVDGKDGHPARIAGLPSERGLVLSDSLSEQAVVAAVKAPSGGSLSAEVLSTDSGGVVSKAESVKIGADQGGVSRVFLNAYLKKDGAWGYRFLVVGGDDSLALLQQGEVVWAREEALAGVVGVQFVNLPPGEESAVKRVEEGIEEWVKLQLLAAKVTLFLASEDEQLQLANARKFSAEKMKVTMDHNGFRRLIVVLTSSGKVLGLHTGDGRVIWSTPPLTKNPQKLFISRTPSSPDTPPEVMVLGKGSGGLGELAWINGHTGEVLKRQGLGFGVDQVIPLPLKDGREQRVVLFVDKEGGAHVVPGTTEAGQLFKEALLGKTYYYRVDKEAGTITGYELQATENPGRTLSEGAPVASSVELWSVVFPKESEEIAAVVRRRADEKVHSQLRTLGNHQVLHKYLNRNTLFVATTTPTNSSKPVDESAVVAYLLDTVTGRVLHRVSHQGVQGPVHGVYSENWLVYSYWNARAHRTEVSALEMFDESHDSDGIDVLGALFGGSNVTTPVSSLAPPPIKVVGQSYFFPQTVKTMAVTVTAKGITGKQVLIGTTSDQIVALDRRFLDPRRPEVPTPADQEEGLIMYREALPFLPTAFITHNTQVEGLRGIVTAPARLESNSLIFGYGIDLFYLRTAPSKTYDLLTEDFSYALLVLTVLILVGAIIVSAAFAQRNALRNNWL